MDSSPAQAEKSTTTDKEAKKSKSSGIEKLLWDVAKKYKTLADKDDVPQISESEDDRKTVAEAYQILTTKRHRQLDARVYNSLTTMQKTRDNKIALEGTTERDRLRMIAWEVKIRTQAVMFVSGDSTIEMDIFRMHDANSVRVLDGDDQELSVEDSIIDDKGVAILETLPIRKLTKDQKEKLKIEFVKKYSGKKFRKKELDSKLDSVNADLLSLLVREKRIVVVKIDSNTVEIIPYSEQYDEDKFTSQSIVLEPKGVYR
ncbi:MAG: hypothetical protein ACTSSH_08880 [Candidatus Heimdallarchaeota archaeon]